MWLECCVEEHYIGGNLCSNRLAPNGQCDCINCTIYLSESLKSTTTLLVPSLPSPASMPWYSNPQIQSDCLLSILTMDATSSAELTRHDLGLELRPNPLPQTTPPSFEVPKRAQQSVKSPSIFPQFSELPFELRTQIWQYAVAQPRIVEIHKVVVKITLQEPTRNPPFPWDWPPKDIIRHYRSKTRDPPLLSTCHESREIAVPIYKKVLSVRVMNGGIYIDFKHDTIFLTPETLC